MLVLLATAWTPSHDPQSDAPDDAGSLISASGRRVSLPSSQPLGATALVAGPAKPPMRSATLLFASGFEDGVVLSSPSDRGSWQHLAGRDSVTGFVWPPNARGGGARLQLLTGVEVDDTSVSTYIVNRIETVTGRTGAPTRALYQGIIRRGTGVTQDPLLFTPSAPIALEGDLYTSEWLKLQPDLVSQLVPGKMDDGNWGNWRVLFEWKTGGRGADYGGDYRIKLSINKDGGGRLYWSAAGDNNANGPLPFETYWNADNHEVPVIAGDWFHLETFTHRSADAGGEFWAKIDGRSVAEHRGPNVGVNNRPINRIMLSQVYTGGHIPAYQWVDDIEIWDGMPASAAGERG